MGTRSVMWRVVGLRSVLCVALACGVVLLAAPAAHAAKKLPPTAEQLVDAYLAVLDKEQAKFDAGTDRIIAKAESQMDRAVERISVRELLKAHLAADKAMTKQMKSFTKVAEKGAIKTLKALSKVTLDPDHALAVRSAAAEAIANAQSIDNETRNGFGDMVEQAIDDIERALDELRGGDEDEPDPDAGSGEAG